MRKQLRILMTCTPAYGHFHPLVPFARAARDRGHAIAFATAPDLVDHVQAAGFDVRQVGLTTHDVIGQLKPEVAEYARLPPPEGRAFIFPRVNTLRARAAFDDLLAVARGWQPDLIVHEAAEFAAPLVAAVMGIPSVNHAYGPRLPEHIVKECGARLADLWASVGQQPDCFGGAYRHLHIDICPPGLQTDRVDPPCRTHTIQPALFDAAPGDELPRWFDELEDRPTVNVTMSTRSAEADLLRLIVESISSLDVNIIAATGPCDLPAALLASTRVHAERYIPHSAVLPRCDLVVCHAGAGIMLKALSSGLPMLLLPRGADQFDNAEACVRLGVGLRLLPSEIAMDTVSAAVRQLLSTSRYADAASRVRSELLALPTAETAVEECELLARSARTNDE